MIVLDKVQKEIVESDAKDILVIAGSGSGKTRILVERVRHLIEVKNVEPQEIICVTFTNAAADEMRERLQDVSGISDAFIGTIHSFANRIYKESGRTYQLLTTEVEMRLMKEILQDNEFIHLTYDKFLEFLDVVSDVEKGIVDPNLGEPENYFAPSEYSNWREARRRMNVIRQERNIITFDELLDHTREYFATLDTDVQHVMLDEAQDVGLREFQFVSGLDSKNTFIVGDDWQCQPAGTKVLNSNGVEVNIEDIEVGDHLTSYKMGDSKGFSAIRKKENTGGYEVLATSKHTAEKLVKLTTKNGKTSTYTHDHVAIAKFNSRRGWITYIAENEKGQFRVGKTSLFTYDNKHMYSGIRHRLHQEGCIRGWILDVFEDKKDAWKEEQIVAAKFGIPQCTFRYREVSYGSEVIDELFTHIPDIRGRVSKALESYGRDIDHPIATTGDLVTQPRNISATHVFEVEACNLFPKFMDVIERNDQGEPEYVEVESIEHINEPTTVYGLSVERYHNYIADGIVTHNCIYSWKGADVSIFKNIAKDPKVAVHKLENNYRSAKEIVDFSLDIIKQVPNRIEKKVNVISDKKGSVKVDSKYKVEEYLRKIAKKPEEYNDWFILCRTNSDVFKVSNMLRDMNVPVDTFKRSNLTKDEMDMRMALPTVKVITVHTAKGLENKNVLVYGNFPLKIASWQTGKSVMEERRVFYVATSRAEEKLIVLN